MTETRIESYTLANKADLYVLDCGACGVVFAIPQAMKKRRYNDGRKFYCPNGHHMSWTETDADRERKRAERAERAATRIGAQRDQAMARADHQAAVARGHKGAHQRTKNRIAKGVCPCCQRSFVDVAKHTG